MADTACGLVSTRGFWPYIRESYPECCSYHFTHRRSLADVAEDYHKMAKCLGNVRKLVQTWLPLDVVGVMQWVDALMSGVSAVESLEAVRRSGKPVEQFLAADFFPALCSLYRQAVALVPQAEEELYTKVDYDALEHLADLVCELARSSGALVVPLWCGKDGNCLVNGVSWAVWGYEYFAAPLRDDLLRELEEHAEWYRDRTALSGEYERVLQEVRERDAHQGGSAWINPKALGAMANLLRRPVCLVDSLQAMRSYGREVEIGEGMCDPDRFGTYISSRSEPQVLKPLVLAWSSPEHNHFVPLVGVHGFKELQLPFFPAVEGDGLHSKLCATRRDEQEGRFSFAMRSIEANTLASWSLFVADYSRLVADLGNVYIFGRAEDPRGLPQPQGVSFEESVQQLHFNHSPKEVWDAYKFDCGRRGNAAPRPGAHGAAAGVASGASASSSQRAPAPAARDSDAPPVKRPRLDAGQASAPAALAAAVDAAREALRPTCGLENVEAFAAWEKSLRLLQGIIEARHSSDFVQKIPLSSAANRARLQLPGAAAGDDSAATLALELMGWCRLEHDEDDCLYGGGCLVRWNEGQEEALKAFEELLGRLLEASGAAVATPEVHDAAWSATLGALVDTLRCTSVEVPPAWEAGMQQLRRAIRKRRDALLGTEINYRQIFGLDAETRALLRAPGTARPAEAVLEVLRSAGWVVKPMAPSKATPGVEEEACPVRPAWLGGDEVGEAATMRRLEVGLRAFVEAIRTLRCSIMELPPRDSQRFQKCWCRLDVAAGSVLAWDGVVEAELDARWRQDELRGSGGGKPMYEGFQLFFDSTDETWFQQAATFVHVHLPQSLQACPRHSRGRLEELLRQRARDLRSSQEPLKLGGAEAGDNEAAAPGAVGGSSHSGERDRSRWALYHPAASPGVALGGAGQVVAMPAAAADLPRPEPEPSGEPPPPPKPPAAEELQPSGGAPGSAAGNGRSEGGASSSAVSTAPKELTYRVALAYPDGKQLLINRFTIGDAATFAEFKEAVRQRLSSEAQASGRPAPAARLRYAERLGQRRRDLSAEEGGRALKDVVRNMSFVCVEQEAEEGSPAAAAPAAAPAATPADAPAPAPAGAEPPAAPAPPAQASTAPTAAAVPSHWLAPSSASQPARVVGLGKGGKKGGKAGGGSRLAALGGGATAEGSSSAERVRDVLQEVLRAARCLEGNQEGEEELCREVALTAMRVLVRHGGVSSLSTSRLGGVLPQPGQRDEKGFREHLKAQVVFRMNEFQTELYKQNRWLAKVPADVLNDEEWRMWGQVLQQAMSEASQEGAEDVLRWADALAKEKHVRLVDPKRTTAEQTLMSALRSSGSAPPTGEGGAAGPSGTGGDSEGGGSGSGAATL